MTAHRNQARDCSPKLNPAGVCNDAPDMLLMEAHTGLTGVIIACPYESTADMMMMMTMMMIFNLLKNTSYRNK